jgi:predicted nucleic acid-binding protein
MRRPAKTQADQRVIENIQNLGANLDQPREVIHFLYFPTEKAACQIAEELKSRGYSLEQGPAPKVEDKRANPYCVIASSRIVLNSTVVHNFRRFFEQLAAFHEGEYDGWEAACEP